MQICMVNTPCSNACMHVYVEVDRLLCWHNFEHNRHIFLCENYAGIIGTFIIIGRLKYMSIRVIIIVLTFIGLTEVYCMHSDMVNYLIGILYNYII